MSSPGGDEVSHAVVIKEVSSKKDGELSVAVNDVVTISSKQNSKAWTANFRGSLGKIPSGNLKIIENYDKAKRGRVKKDQKGEDSNHLTVKTGDVVLLLEQQGSKWLAILNDHQGLVSADNVEVLAGLDLLYQQFADLILKDDLIVTNALCTAVPVTAADQVSKALINVFEAKGNTFKLLKAVIEEEARNTTSASTLFRSNSMASKLMSVYGRLTGQEYLHSTLRPLVRWIGASATSFEIDPAKMVGGDIIEENRKNLMEGAELFFNGIRRSISACPPAFRAICYVLQQSVIERFPESKHSVVGGFFFLRFMCPAIISPEGFGVLADGQVLLDEARRALVLVSKLLQNLANGKLFGSKEAYMVPMQEFIINHQDEINLFFDELADVNINELKTEAIINVSESEYKDFLRYLHGQFCTHQSKVEECLKKRAAEVGADPDSYAPLLELRSILSQLGTPETAKRAVASPPPKKK
eukprot:TRINITY_DN1191_c0_g1_i1.p1 TRINITY_DN1191_c0_g1~~TRINITY_DN1191_c0_g1_i1.p1  ORF type:complete len:471 (-),score=100.56 TRINITY_DN1191_c0_g1_i1:110-1522(-)